MTQGAEQVDEARDTDTDSPAGWGHIRVPTSSRQAALAGLSLYTPWRRQGVGAQRVAWWLVWLLGPRALPGRRTFWVSPLGEGLWSELLARWRLSSATSRRSSASEYRPSEPGRTGHELARPHAVTRAPRPAHPREARACAELT